MNIQPKQPSARATPDRFTGSVWVDSIAAPQEDGQRMIVAKVRFSPGARTAWHSHARGQTLHVTEGVALMQSRAGEIIEVHPGQTIYTPAGEEHWHGATPDDFMEHLAMLEQGDDPTSTTTWLEHVTDDEYRRPPAACSPEPPAAKQTD
ncbi:cupin domain-containing protein [Sinomonas sp. ASV322]|uniref:(R)-mandelonitrile lyase n=1 Tax=Sinomonas sp. ASV322 TaxID=3041920 RepID=UPI0027DB12E7|nr:cupin domain-containing protein [Sinomonas sp. ASV322]MDQ4503595.1 cupin domain-containing protein [Sinomonas sp. ASV322]